jgi:hypothetical protein
MSETTMENKWTVEERKFMDGNTFFCAVNTIKNYVVAAASKGDAEVMVGHLNRLSRPVTDDEIDAMFPYASSPIEAMREGAKALRDKYEGKG